MVSDLEKVRFGLEIAISSSREEDVQRFLTSHPWILTDTFATRSLSGMVTECIPKFRLGTEYVTDFVLVTGTSYHYDIVLIELEPPTERPFTKDGKFASRLNGALTQLDDWQDWTRENEPYFRRSLAKAMSDSYGADQIGGVSYNLTAGRSRREHVFISSKVLVGRRGMLSWRDNRRRATVYGRSNRTLEIVPYDRLLDTVDRTINAERRTRR